MLPRTCALVALVLSCCGEAEAEEQEAHQHGAILTPPVSTLPSSLPPLAEAPQRLEATLSLNPNGTTPLAAAVSAVTSVPTRASVEVRGPENWVVDFDDLSSDHRLPIVGFRAAQRYEVTVRLSSEDGKTVLESDPMPVETGPLPDGFPEVEVLAAEPSRMEPGHTLFSVHMASDYQVIVDGRGEVIWYHVVERSAWDIRQLADGQLLLEDGGVIKMMNLLGDVTHRYEPDPMDTLYHHEIAPSRNGGFWTLGNRTVNVTRFPTDYDDLSHFENVAVTDDILIELDPEQGVVQRIFLLDVLDPLRLGYDSLNPHPELGTPRDWAHANGIIEVDDGESLIVSSRHQDAVFKVKSDGSGLVWILGNHSNWSEPFRRYLLEPTGEGFQWPYHQHAPELTPTGTMLLFDNANHQASPSDGKRPVADSKAESRSVEYRIDEQAMTVEQVWEYAHRPHRYFSAVVGDADLQPNTNNVLVTYGALAGADDVGGAELDSGALQARIVEVARDAANDVVFELAVYLDDPRAWGCLVYRAERISPIR